MERDELIEIPQWAIKDEFEVSKGKMRRLTLAESRLYAFLFTRCTSYKNSRYTYSASIAALSAATGLCERTVQKALRVLLIAGLIYRTVKDRGYIYTLNYKLVLSKERKVNRISQSKPMSEVQSQCLVNQLKSLMKEVEAGTLQVAERQND